MIGLIERAIREELEANTHALQRVLPELIEQGFTFVLAEEAAK